METIKQYRAALWCVGVKKKCRKVDRHRVSLGYVPLDSDLDKLKEQAIMQAKGAMKVIVKAQLHLDMVKVNGDRETWAPFDYETEKLKRIIKLEVSNVQNN